MEAARDRIGHERTQASSTSLYLIGFRNRVVVLFEWAWAYVTYQRSASVIITDQRPPRFPLGASDAPVNN